MAEVPLWSMDAAETTATIDEVLAAEAQLAELRPGCCPTPRPSTSPARPAPPRPRTGWPTTPRITRRAAHRTIRLADGPRGPRADPRRARRRAAARRAGRGDPPRDRRAARRPRPRPGRPGRDPPDRAKPPTTTPRPSRSSAAGCSRSSTPTPPTPTRPNSSNARSATAAAATRLTMWDDGHGKTHGRFTLDTALTGAALKKALYAFAAPKHQATQGPLGGRRPTPERLGQAFAETDPALPRQQAPQGRWPQRHRRGHHDPRHPAGRAQGRPPRHRRDHLPRHWPADSPVRPGSSPPSSTASPRSSTSAARSGSTTDAQRIVTTIEATAAARSRAATGHPACPTCTTPSPGARAAAPTATPS